MPATTVADPRLSKSNRHANEKLSQLQKMCREYECELNDIGVDDLFDQYRQIGFLYPEKVERLQPYWAEIKDNWHRVLRAGGSLKRIVTYDKPDSKAWASITAWRTTHSGWNTQHLVSEGKPLASRAVLLAAQELAINDSNPKSCQNWFRPTNRLPKRMFGSIEKSIGEANASVNTYSFMEVTPGNLECKSSAVRIEEVALANQDELATFATENRGSVYSAAEELTHPDFNLCSLDTEYQKVGLRRYRRAWLAKERATGVVVAAIISYRGPLGLNFSFLENRSDLLVSQNVKTSLVQEGILRLVSSASDTYEDFSPGYIPVITDDPAASILEGSGGKYVRQYSQSIWLRAGYQDWYNHCDSFYSRIMKRLN